MSATLAEPLSPPAPTPTDAVAGADTTALFILGTPGSGWRPLAGAVWRAFEQAPGQAGRVPPGGVVDDSGATLPAAAPPGARYLLWVEHPARMLAHRFTDPAQAQTGAEQALAEWRDAARRLLALAYRSPARCLLVEAQEAVADPSALVQALARWDGRFAGMTAPEMAPEAGDPLHEALAIAALAADGPTQRLFEELHAACIALREEGEPGDADDGAAAAPPLRLDAARQSLHDLRAEIARLAAEAVASRGAAEQAARSAEAQSATLRSERDVARQESELLLAQLHQVQEELETVFLQHQDAERKLAEAGSAAAEQARRLKASDARIDQALAERDAQARLAEERSAALEQAESKRRPLQEQLAAATQAAAAAEQARSLAAQQTQALRRELDEALSQMTALQSRLAQLEARLKAQEEARLQAQSQAQSDAAAARSREVQLVERAEQAEQARADLARQAADTQQQLDSAREESELLLAQLHQVQEELETTFLRAQQQAATASSRIADLEQRLAEDHAAAERNRHSLQQQLAQVLAGAERNQERQLLLDRQRNAELAQLREAVATARQEAQLTTRQMALMQEALERHDAAARRAALPPALEVDEVILGSPRLQPPHLELALTLRGLRLFGQEIDTLDARLVEHHGHPGLTLLDGPAPGAGLGAFAEHGRDGDRPYMLLVPTDAPARGALALLGTHDWLVVRGIVVALEQALAQRGDGDATRWRQVARRLQAELDDLPPRLRYDRLDVEPDPAAAGAFRVRFGHALFGARFLEQIALRWRPAPPAAGTAPLALLLPMAADENPPLAAWPPGEQGNWAAEWALPLGGTVEPAARRAAWRSLPAADHALVLALLDALPAAVHLLAAEGRLPAGLQRDALVASIARWVAEAEDVEDPANPLRRIARRLRRRRGAAG
jgi:hypothetical protein